MHNQPTS